MVIYTAEFCTYISIYSDFDQKVFQLQVELGGSRKRENERGRVFVCVHAPMLRSLLSLCDVARVAVARVTRPGGTLLTLCTVVC